MCSGGTGGCQAVAFAALPTTDDDGCRSARLGRCVFYMGGEVNGTDGGVASDYRCYTHQQNGIPDDSPQQIHIRRPDCPFWDFLCGLDCPQLPSDIGIQDVQLLCSSVTALVQGAECEVLPDERGCGCASDCSACIVDGYTKQCAQVKGASTTTTPPTSSTHATMQMHQQHVCSKTCDTHSQAELLIQSCGEGSVVDEQLCFQIASNFLHFSSISPPVANSSRVCNWLCSSLGYALDKNTFFTQLPCKIV